MKAENDIRNIRELLLKENTWLNTQEIGKKLGVNTIIVTKSMTKLKKSKMIIFKKINNYTAYKLSEKGLYVIGGIIL